MYVLVYVFKNYVKQVKRPSFAASTTAFLQPRFKTWHSRPDKYQMKPTFEYELLELAKAQLECTKSLELKLTEEIKKTQNIIVGIFLIVSICLGITFIVSMFH